MTPSELRVRRVSHRGHVVEWVLNPLWVQLDQKTHAEFGIEKLYLVSKGRRVSIGEFSGPGRKSKLCQSLNGSTAGRQARPDLQSGVAEGLSGIGWFREPRPAYIMAMMNLAMNEHRLDQTGPPERRAARL